MLSFLPRLLVVSFLFLSSITILTSASSVGAAPASHIVISEIQTAGETANDEFIELYNPTSNDIDLNGWRLTRKTEGGSQSNLVASFSGEIKAKGYLLIVNPSCNGSAVGDVVYSATSAAIANNNTVILYNDAGTSIVDKVGLGEALDVESSASANPTANGSVERKANSTSTNLTMAIGGLDEFMGNAEDSNNNASDFVARETSQPQNSQSAIEPFPSTPTNTPTISPTASPTLTPTNTPTATLTPTVTATPTTTITPTPEPKFPSFSLQCTTKTLSVRALHIGVSVSYPSCKIVRP